MFLGPYAFHWCTKYSNLIIKKYKNSINPCILQTCLFSQTFTPSSPFSPLSLWSKEPLSPLIKKPRTWISRVSCQNMCQNNQIVLLISDLIFDISHWEIFDIFWRIFDIFHIKNFIPLKKIIEKFTFIFHLRVQYECKLCEHTCQHFIHFLMVVLFQGRTCSMPTLDISCSRT